MEREQEKENPQRKFNPTPTPPPRSTSTPTEPQPNDPTDKGENIKKPKGKQWFNKTKRRLVSYTLNIITVIIGVYLLREAHRQADISSDTLRFQRVSDSLNTIEQRRTNDSILAVAKKSVEITERGLNFQQQREFISAKSQKTRDSINMKSFILQNRAYVSVDSLFCTLFERGKKFTTWIKFANHGQTPALGCEVYAVAYITDSLPIPKKSFSLPINKVSVIPLAPNQRGESILDTLIDDNTFDLIKSGKRFVAWQGSIFYYDIFNRNDTTNFSVLYLPDNNYFGYDKWNEIK
jgi:hypothetical protein